MKRFLTAILLVASISILLFSCKDTTMKMNSFVTAYNKTVNRYTNSIVTYSEAEALFNKKIIKIKFLTSYGSEDARNSLLQTLAPSTFSQLLLNDKLPRELINEGVTFEVEFLTKNAVIFSHVLVDQKKLIELESNPKKVDASNLQNAPSSTGDSDLADMLSALNKSLPFKDKNIGFTITKIDINLANELIYHVVVPNHLASRIKGTSGAEMMKDDILRNSDIKKLILAVKHLGITSIKYKYEDEHGNSLNETALSEKDLY